MSKRLSTFRRQNSIAYVERTGASVDGRATTSKLHELNINDGPGLCFGLLPHMPTAYFSASLLVPVKTDRCLYFVTDFEIVCLDHLPFYRNDVTRSALAHEYAKSWPNWPHCQLCRWFISTLTKVMIFVESCFNIQLCRQCVLGFGGSVYNSSNKWNYQSMPTCR